MDTHEAARRRIYERTRDTWDEDTAEAFMTALPNTSELATRADLDAVKEDLQLVKHDLQLLRQELQQDGELLRQELKHDGELLRRDLEHGLEVLRKDVESSQHQLSDTFHKEMTSLTKALFFSLSGMMITLAIATNLFG